MSRFRRRLMGLSALRQAFKDDFVRVEYIENTSHTAYIDTKIIANQNTNYEIKVQFTKNTGYPYIFGSQTAQKDRRFSLMEGSYNTFYYISNLHKQEINLSLTAEQQTANLTIKKDGLNMYIDGVKAGAFTNTTFTTPTSLTIFTYHFANGSIDTGHQFYGKLYYFKIYDGTTLVRDFIPMYQISTDTYGLWDRVEEKFYTSPNGVKFTGGARVVADADDNLYYIKNYISSNDNINAYIRLRQFKNTDNIEFKIYKKRNNDSWFGSRAATPIRNHFAVNGYSGGINMNYGSNSPTRIINGVENNKTYTIRVYDREVFLNGKKIYTWGSQTFTTNSSATLGKVDGVNNLASNCNWYYFKWWNVNEDLVYDLIPVQSVDSGKYGMFDKVSLVFHPSNGSANFIGG